MQACLPASIYDAIYHPTFAFYQKQLRNNYQRKMNSVRRSGDRELAEKMQCVFNVMEYSLISTPGLEHTFDLAQDLVDRGIPGGFVECGVAQGGCAALIAQVAEREGKGRQSWFFDSYEGLPDPTEADFEGGKTGHHIRPLPKGSCLGTYEQVSELLFDEMKLSRDTIHLVKGWFEDTLPVQKEAMGPVALLRVDGDWYDSTMCVLDNLYGSVSEGGHVLIDDYCSCFGAQKATDEFLDKNNIETTLVPDGRGGASFQKPQTNKIAKAA